MRVRGKTAWVKKTGKIVKSGREVQPHGPVADEGNAETEHGNH